MGGGICSAYDGTPQRCCLWSVIADRDPNTAHHTREPCTKRVVQWLAVFFNRLIPVSWPSKIILSILSPYDYFRFQTFVSSPLLLVLHIVPLASSPYFKKSLAPETYVCRMCLLGRTAYLIPHLSSSQMSIDEFAYHPTSPPLMKLAICHKFPITRVKMLQKQQKEDSIVYTQILPFETKNTYVHVAVTKGHLCIFQTGSIQVFKLLIKPCSERYLQSTPLALPVQGSVVY